MTSSILDPRVASLPPATEVPPARDENYPWSVSTTSTRSRGRDAGDQVAQCRGVRPPDRDLTRVIGVKCTSTVRPRRLVTRSTRTRRGCRRSPDQGLSRRRRRRAHSAAGSSAGASPQLGGRASSSALGAFFFSGHGLAVGRHRGRPARREQSAWTAWLLDLQGALGARQALELLPVAVIFSTQHGLVGWAPTPSQYCARSESISIRESALLRVVRPMTSIERP
jgi:hypothetical protein